VVVLDFQNETESITQAFQDYFRTTVLSEETDPYKLNDLLHEIEAAQVYSPEQAALIVERFLSGAPREALDSVLEACVETYEKTLDVDAQIKFKGNARAFTRTYEFLGAVMTQGKPAWERASIVLNLLLLKLPKIEDEDLAQGILEQVDMDKYRAERQTVEKLALADQDSLIDPVPVGEGGGRPDPKFDRLSNLLEEFNQRFGGKFKDGPRIAKRLQDDIAPKVAADPALQNARKNTPQTARLQLAHTLNRVMLDLIKDDTEVYKQFVQDPAFKQLVTEMIAALTDCD
jgi:type I restriction enzyme R subunit